MTRTSWVVCAAALLAGCSVNGSTPTTSWGKNHVSMADYRTDANECTLLAVTESPAETGDKAAAAGLSRDVWEQQARMEALSSCLVRRGYTEFQLTADQREQLARLPEGSAERREYLYKLGSDEEILAKQSVKKQ